MARNQHPIVYYPAVATLGVLARETGDLFSSAALLGEALAPLHDRADQASVIGIYWHKALLAWAEEDACTAEEQLRLALKAMRLGGYGTTLLWQPARFVKLCMWAIERKIEAPYAVWLLQTSLASWVTASGKNPSDNCDGGIDGYAPIGFASVLTPREREVLELAVQGLGDKAIADKLIISVRTVQCHLYRCYQKLGVSGRTAAMRLVLQERE